MFNNKRNDESKKQAKKPNFLFLGLAAAYLVYLAYSLLKDNLLAGKSEDAKPIFVIFAVIFIIVAIWIAFYIYKQSKIQKAENEKSYQELLKDEEEEYMRTHSGEAADENAVLPKADINSEDENLENLAEDNDGEKDNNN